VYTQVSELAQFEDACYAAHGEVRVKRQVTGFKKIKFYTLENIGSGLFSLPVSRQPRLKDAIHGLGNVLKTVATVLLLSDPHDLAVAALDESHEIRNVVLYDNYPGGIGQSDPLFRRREEMIAAALDLAAACPCEACCPSCVGPYTEVGPRGKKARWGYSGS
jgi:DEAD/DEAH box helicase domain-containing protein